MQLIENPIFFNVKINDHVETRIKQMKKSSLPGSATRMADPSPLELLPCELVTRLACLLDPSSSLALLCCSSTLKDRLQDNLVFWCYVCKSIGLNRSARN